MYYVVLICIDGDAGGDGDHISERAQYPAYVACWILSEPSPSLHPVQVIRCSSFGVLQVEAPELGDVRDGGFPMVFHGFKFYKRKIKNSNHVCIVFLDLDAGSTAMCIFWGPGTTDFSGTFSIFLLQTFCSPLPQDMRELHGSFCALKISMVGKAGTVESEFTSENM